MKIITEFAKSWTTLLCLGSILMVQTKGESVINKVGVNNDDCVLSDGTLTQCADSAFCLQKCTCPLEGTHWSDIQSKCVALEGTSCSEILNCTDNAVCSFNTNICNCQKGYSHTQDNHCLAGYGSKCNASEHPNLTSCNSDNFLHCSSQQVCSCQSNYTWDGHARCRAQPGQKCDLKVTSDMTKVSICIQPAKCIPWNITEDGDQSQLRIGSCDCLSPRIPIVDTETGDITCSNGCGRRLLLESGIFLAILITILVS